MTGDSKLECASPDIVEAKGVFHACLAYGARLVR
jgi:hypothetical protein